MTTTELTTEDREHIERYTSFKTDASPITKAMRKALAIIDTQAAALAAEEKNCIALHKANQKQIAIIQEQRASLAERDAEIAALKEQLAAKEREWGELRAAKRDTANFAFRHPYMCEVCGKEIRYFVELAQIAGPALSAHSLHGECWKKIGEPLTHEALVKALNIAPAAEGGGE